MKSRRRRKPRKVEAVRARLLVWSGLAILAAMAGGAALRAQAVPDRSTSSPAGSGGLLTGHRSELGKDPAEHVAVFHQLRAQVVNGPLSVETRPGLEALAAAPDGRARTLARLLLARIDRSEGRSDAGRWLDGTFPAEPDLAPWRAVVAGGGELEAMAMAVPASSPLATAVWIEAARTLEGVSRTTRLTWLQQAVATAPTTLGPATLALRLELGDPGALEQALGRRDLASLWVPLLKEMTPRTRSAEERLKVAGALMDQGHYGPASRWLEDLRAPLALYRRARCLARTGQPTEARKWLVRAAEADPSLGARVRLTQAEMLLAEGKASEAAKQARIVANGRDKTARGALVFLLKTHLKADRMDAAARIDAELIRRFPGAEAAADARWRALWRAHDSGRLSEAVQRAGELARGNGGYQAPASFWLGRFAEDRGDLREARRYYASTARLTPTGYYGWRARMRGLALDGGQDPGFRLYPKPLTSTVDPLATWVPATGSLTPHAGEPSTVQGWPPEVRLLAAAGVYPAELLPAGPDRIALAYAQGEWAKGAAWAKDDPATAFPLAYADPLFRAAAREDLDPLYLLALVKQESAFDPLARSWVGATGLAQLMPFTADWVARQLSAPPRALTDPDWNLQLGAWYLAHAGRELDGDRVLQTAAYNAGIGAAKRWRGMLPRDTEIRIEHIPYKETRHYVKKVFGYYWTYQSRYRTPDFAAWPPSPPASPAR